MLCPAVKSSLSLHGTKELVLNLVTSSNCCLEVDRGAIQGIPHQSPLVGARQAQRLVLPSLSSIILSIQHLHLFSGCALLLGRLRAALMWRKKTTPRKMARVARSCLRGRAVGYIHDFQAIDGRAVAVFTMFGHANKELLTNIYGLDKYMIEGEQSGTSMRLLGDSHDQGEQSALLQQLVWIGDWGRGRIARFPLHSWKSGQTGPCADKVCCRYVPPPEGRHGHW